MFQCARLMLKAFGRERRTHNVVAGFGFGAPGSGERRHQRRATRQRGDDGCVIPTLCESVAMR